MFLFYLPNRMSVFHVPDIEYKQGLKYVHVTYNLRSVLMQMLQADLRTHSPIGTGMP